MSGLVWASRGNSALGKVGPGVPALAHSAAAGRPLSQLLLGSSRDEGKWQPVAGLWEPDSGCLAAAAAGAAALPGLRAGRG